MLKLDLAALRPWLQLHLEPICDADPAVLSEYIVALLKHDVSIDELKKLFQEQLEDFLGQETAPFITRLFFFLTTPPSLASLRADPPQGPRGMKRSLDPTASQSSVPSAKRGQPLPTGPKPNQAIGITSHLPQNPGQPGRRVSGPAGRRGDAPPPRELCKDYHYRGFCARGAGCPFMHDDGAPPTLSQPPFFAPFPPGPPYPTPPSQHPHLPPVGYPQPPRFMPPPPGPHGGRRGFGPNPNSDNDGRALSTTTLAIENVPREALSSANVRQFFARFGVVEGVAVDPPGLRALVTFATPDEAKRALSSPEAIFGNRFVRVYRAREAINPPPRMAVGPRPHPPSSPAATASRPSAISTPQGSSPPSVTFKPSPSTSQRAEDLAKESRKAAERATKLQENASAQKVLMEQLELLPAGSSAERTTIMSSLRKLASEAAALAKLSTSQATSNTALKPEEQLALLRQEAASLGIDASSPRAYAPRGRGSFRASRGGFASRGRGGLPQSFRLDNRAKKIVVGDVSTTTALPVLRNYFERFGEVLLLNPTASSTEYLVEFKTRQSAEEALAQGSNIPEVGRVSLRWATAETAKAASPQRASSAGEDTPMKDQEAPEAEAGDREVAPNPSARLVEDDEDDTERSWNR